MGKTPRRNLCGVLLLDKPFGLSSNAALIKTKILYQALKAGHTGTLDPFATGLLPICFGEATKFAGYMLDATKAYDARMRLGYTSNTGDAEGELVFQQQFCGSQAEIESTLEKFRGRISQIPPMYSALKHQGRPLYQMARQGIEIERLPRDLIIHELTLHEMQENELRIRVVCSKGTYIRVLAQDIGKALGCGAYLSALRRTATGNFNLADSHGLDELGAMTAEQRDQLLLPADSLLQDLPAVVLPEDQARLLGRGTELVNPTAWGQFHEKSIKTRIYGENGHFYGLALADSEGKIVAERMMALTA
ncbi:MAG: tRNA pseudouridine(55) synthase TruB [Burkholderiales bacterium]